MIYLDNAATSWPKPEIVYQTMDKFLREMGGNPGHGSHSLAVAANQVIDETRVQVARFINALEPERIIFTSNCTDSLNLGLKGLLKPGDHVIVSGLEHNAVVRPLRKLAKQGIKVTIIPISSETGVVSVQNIAAAITKETRLVCCIHASNVNGAIQPIAEYGAVAREHNLIFMVDTAQSAGHYPIDVQSANIDLLAFSGHKGTFGPPGVGVLYIGPRAKLDTVREGGTSFSDSEDQPSRLPNKYESGTLNSVGIAGLGAGLKFIDSEGFSTITTHESLLTKILIEGLSKMPGVISYPVPTGTPQAPVISFNIGGYDPAEVGMILDKAFDIKVRASVQCANEAHRSLGTLPYGTVRVSPGYFNTEAEIEKTLQAIKMIVEVKLK